jgi:hypothetical protein
MTRMKHTVTAILVMLIAFAADEPSAFAAGPAPGVDRSQAEVQIGLCSPIDHIVQALDLRPRGAPIEVWQFDDPAMTLFARGLRVRLRVAADGRAQLTLKVANQDCARFDAKLVPPGEGKCEYDVYGTTTAGAVSLNSKLDARNTRELLAGRAALANVLSPPQIRYLRETVGMWPLPDGIRSHGPMQVRTYRTAGGLYDVDISHLPNGERYAEISAKVTQPDAASTTEMMKAELQRAGVEMCVDQSSQAANKLRFLLR